MSATTDEINPLVLFQDIMQEARKKNSKNVIPPVCAAEPRIGYRDYDSELIEFAKRIGNCDVLCGTDLLGIEMESKGKGDRWNRRYRNVLNL